MPVSHLTLTGTEVHEPKGVENASLGEVYVADGNGSGNWSNVGTSTFTGMIADFPWPRVQTGWLECNGTDISTSTYSALYDVMTIQMTGTRISGNPTITSLSSTADMRVGYFVFGTGIAAGTTIVSINSGSQITLSGNASSSGTATVVVSPWLMDTGTIRLPNLSGSGRYRRSRTTSGTTAVGQLQDDTFRAHQHEVGGTTGNASADHSHSFSGNTGPMSANSVHNHVYSFPSTIGAQAAGSGQTNYWNGSAIATATNAVSTEHFHSISGTTGGMSNTHNHSFYALSNMTGSAETRPTSLVLMTCIKY